MGPRFCKRGNLVSRICNPAPAGTLQWGHAFVSVETARLVAALADHLSASMGPRFCKRGNQGGLLGGGSTRMRFNGATLL